MKSRKKSIKKRKGPKLLLPFIFILLCVAGLFYYYSSDKSIRSASIRVKKSAFLSMVPDGFESIGIDISHHQGSIDWDRLFEVARFDTLISFVYCKATEGADHIDSRYSQFRKELNKRGIPNGSYHFFSATSDPILQADHFLKNWEQKEMDLPPVVDVEVEFSDDSLMMRNIAAWLNRVEEKSGMRPIIYTSLHFFETKFTNKFKDHKFWIAAYSRKPECIEDARIIHWQFSEDGVLPGIDEPVDLNVSKIRFL
ncbi:MAG: glycoside hydrolase family 25 protein [Bacteroidetes bacterium]|nr:MAG: glycoside hydrolase family 25 protein [Bacteroidota bacterium]